MNTHIPVLTEEAIEGLNLSPSHTVIDATLGSAGHAREILKRLGPNGTYVGIDADKTAIDGAKDALSGGKPTVHLITGNFRHIDSIVEREGITQADAILADLGWRMEQFSGSGKGFSFQTDEPLIMTLGEPEDYAFTAADIVNDWREEDIVNVLLGYGEERYARRIARGITEARERQPLTTTKDLVRVIEASVPGAYRYGRIHPATRTFQALRIAVNDELQALGEFIEKSMNILKDDGRLAIITFHSIEDRIVKYAMKDAAAKGRGAVLTKKPITPTDDEIGANPRSRSAKLRIFKKHEAIPDNSSI